MGYCRLEKKSSWFDLVISVLTRCGRMGLVFGEKLGRISRSHAKKRFNICGVFVVVVASCCSCYYCYLICVFCFIIICYYYRNKKVKRVWGEHWGTGRPQALWFPPVKTISSFPIGWLTKGRCYHPPCSQAIECIECYQVYSYTFNILFIYVYILVYIIDSYTHYIYIYIHVINSHSMSPIFLPLPFLQDVADGFF